jgi:hypothetical protein
MGRDRFCCLRRMITGLATMTVERLNARVVLNTRMTLVVDPSMNHHLAAVHWSMLNRSRALHQHDTRCATQYGPRVAQSSCLFNPVTTGWTCMRSFCDITKTPPVDTTCKGGWQ